MNGTQILSLSSLSIVGLAEYCTLQLNLQICLNKLNRFLNFPSIPELWALTSGPETARFNFKLLRPKKPTQSYYNFKDLAQLHTTIYTFYVERRWKSNENLLPKHLHIKIWYQKQRGWPLQLFGPMALYSKGILNHHVNGPTKMLLLAKMLLTK